MTIQYGDGMARPRLFQHMKVLLARSGLRPARILTFINGVLKFGQWLHSTNIPVVLDDRNALYVYLRDEYLTDVPIDYLEFGIWKGAILKQRALLNPHPDAFFLKLLFQGKW